MVVAGTESTASAIRSVLVHTMSTPAVYAQLKAEIASAVRSGAASSPIIRNEEAVKLPVLQAVIYEGIRMRPPLLGLLPKVVPKGGDTLAGQRVPAGTAICANASSLLRSEALFGPETDVFRPARFLDLPDDDARAAMQRNVELAFGWGQWQCVGKTIAFMELHKIVFEVSQIPLPGSPHVCLRGSGVSTSARTPSGHFLVFLSSYFPCQSSSSFVWESELTSSSCSANLISNWFSP